MPFEIESNREKRAGGRRLSAAHIAYRKQAETVKLGIVCKAQLRSLAERLPSIGIIRAADALLLMRLIDSAPMESFLENGLPVVFKSNRRLAEELDKTPVSISRGLRRLADAGLITFQDSGNCKRFPHKGSDGAIINACGINLAILIVRHDELRHMVKAQDAERRQGSAARVRLKGAIRDVRNAIMMFNDEKQHLCCQVQIRLDRIIGLAKKASSRGVKTAIRLCLTLLERLVCADRPLKNQTRVICQHVQNVMHIQDTDSYPSVKPTKSGGASNRPARPGKEGEAKETVEENVKCKAKEARMMNDAGGIANVTLADVLTAFPALAMMSMSPIRSWADLRRLSPVLCRYLGISDAVYHQVVETMGPLLASVALSLTLEKMERQEVMSPGGYLRALMHRAGTGDMHLHRTIRAILRRNSRAVTL